MAYSRESFPRTYPGTQVGEWAPVFFLPRDWSFRSDHPLDPYLAQSIICLLSPHRWSHHLGEMQSASFP